jgi:hypothetical protein
MSEPLHVGCGSIASIPRCPRYVRLCSKSGDKADMETLRVRAISGSSAGVAVGTCVSSHAPRTEPYVRLSRIRLPPWVCDGEAVAGHLPYAFQRL